MRRRDRAYNGAFVFAVRTTRVTAARAAPRERPTRGRVVYPTAEAAAQAGYRACKRCQPDKLGAPDPKVEAVKPVCERIAAAKETPKLVDLAAAQA